MGYVTKFEIGDFIVQNDGRKAMGIVKSIKIADLANLKAVIHYMVEANGTVWEIAEHAATLVKGIKFEKQKPKCSCKCNMLSHE